MYRKRDLTETVENISGKIPCIFADNAQNKPTPCTEPVRESAYLRVIFCGLLKPRVVL